MPGSLSHLTARFFEVLTAKPLADHEKAVISEWLSADLAEIFFSQPTADQRHGYECAMAVTEREGIAEAVEAALMHDVGKRHARLGVIGRSLASVLIRLGLPLPARFAIYRDHGLIAARELAEASASRLTVDFAANHHGSRPSGIDHDVWELLLLADQPANSRR